MTWARVFSGGGDKIAYQAGASLALEECFSPKFGLECGVSAGAMAAFWFGHGYPAATLCSIVSKLQPKDLYRSWRFGWLEGVFRGGSYNPAPLQDFLKNYDSPKARSKAKIGVRLGTVGLESGKFHVATEKYEDLWRWAYASAAHPIAFPPARIQGRLWTDGGLRDNIPLQVAVDDGYSQVVLIQTTPIGPLPKPAKSKLPLLVTRTLREVQIVLDEATLDDVDFDSPKLKELRVIAPKRPLPSNMLRFTPSSMSRMIDLGYQDAINAIKGW